jgi:aryl-alcohol dehydrogenase-like predicted oxidoreductase
MPPLLTTPGPDEPAPRAVLDAYVGAGGNFVETSNSYLVEHGRSETIIGRWMADRGNRDQIVVATKVGGGRGPVRNLRPERILREAHASLERLRADRIDLYYAHYDDFGTPWKTPCTHSTRSSGSAPSATSGPRTTHRGGSPRP